ncbi:MAG: hypothetical protein ACJ74Y_04220 [Bryobacteraceae bacterium]
MSTLKSVNKIFLALVTAAGLSAASTDFTGHWQIDQAKSKPGPEPTVSLDVQQQGNTVTFVRQYQDHDGKSATARFTCAVGSSTCDFDENGHKAKVSIWFNGPELVILKTDGEKHDDTVEWHMKLSENGKTLTINREIIAPNDDKESLVFNKSESVASR